MFRTRLTDVQSEKEVIEHWRASQAKTFYVDSASGQCPSAPIVLHNDRLVIDGSGQL